MSSILKALRKLENKDSKQDQSYSWSRDAGVRETINQQAKISWLMNKFIFGLVLVIILAGTGWFVLSQKSQKPVSETVTAEKKIAAAQTTTVLKTEIKDLKSVAASENKLSEVQAEDEPKSVAEKAPAKPEPPKFISHPEKKISEQPAIAQKEPARIEEKKPAEKKKAAPPKDLSPADEKKLADLKLLENELPKLREIATPEQSRNLELIEEEIDVLREKIKSGELDAKDRKSFPSASAPAADDSKLKIQAIVWSNNPKDRMAMINDNIVRVGGVAEGLTVTYIGEDYITVKDGEEERTIKFQLK